MTEQNRVIRQNAFGGPENITMENLPVPTPSSGEVLVRVAAAGLNPVDWKIAAYPPVAEAFGVAVPGGYGNDFAGTVTAIGDGVNTVAVGDRVVGSARGAAVADYTVVAADALTAVPDAVSLTVAGTLPVAARTAVAVVDQLHLGPEDTVLIGGAAGGVGILTVQLAVRTGAVVVGTASESNHALLRELGAIPVTYGDGLAERVLAATDRPLTAAIDLQGSATAETAIALGVAPGRITTIAAYAHPVVGAIATGGEDARPDAISDVLAGLADSSLRVVISGEYPIEQTAQAVTRLQEGHVQGKLVILTGAE